MLASEIMASQADVRRIALSLPGAVEGDGHFAFAVPNQGKAKGFAWVWMERVVPKKPRVANPAVLAIRVEGAEVKAMLLSSDEKKFFTEPHYQGFPAVLVRLAAIGAAELEELLTQAWRCQAPRTVVEAFDAGRTASSRSRSSGKAKAPRRAAPKSRR